MRPYNGDEEIFLDEGDDPAETCIDEDDHCMTSLSFEWESQRSMSRVFFSTTCRCFGRTENSLSSLRAVTAVTGPKARRGVSPQV